MPDKPGATPMKPCPGCGSLEIVIERLADGGSEAICAGGDHAGPWCDWRGPARDTATEAIAAWNTRVNSAPRLLAALKDLLSEFTVGEGPAADPRDEAFVVKLREARAAIAEAEGRDAD